MNILHHKQLSLCSLILILCHGNMQAKNVFSRSEHLRAFILGETQEMQKKIQPQETLETDLRLTQKENAELYYKLGYFEQKIAKLEKKYQKSQSAAYKYAGIIQTIIKDLNSKTLNTVDPTNLNELAENIKTVVLDLKAHYIDYTYCMSMLNDIHIQYKDLFEARNKLAELMKNASTVEEQVELLWGFIFSIKNPVYPTPAKNSYKNIQEFELQ